MGNQLVNLKIIEHVENAHVFKNAYLFYTFLDDKLHDKRAIKVTLKQILRRQDFICIFMQHLSQEFSQELLLALIEFIQFRQLSQQTLDQTTNSNEFKDMDPETEISKLEMCPDLPKSSIVHNETFSDFEKAGMLYDKYVAIGSQYEINIGAAERNRLMARFEIPEESIIKSLTGTFLGSGSSGSIRRKGEKGDNPKFFNTQSESVGDQLKLAFEFDSCNETLLKLLGYSLSRFKSKPLYHKMAELL